MAGHLVQHVLQERQPGIQFALAGAIQIDGDLDLGFQGVALNSGAALAHLYLQGLPRAVGRLLYAP